MRNLVLLIAMLIVALGSLAFLWAALDLLEELPDFRRSMEKLPVVAQTAGVIGIGLLLWRAVPVVRR